jgi:hypothetical protein
MAIQTAFWVAVNTEYATITPVSARFRATAATTRNRDLIVAGAPRLVRLGHASRAGHVTKNTSARCRRALR